jgi:hypothetical protein
MTSDNGNRTKTVANFASAEGRAWSDGWNDYLLGVPMFYDRDYVKSYELGRLYAAECKARRIPCDYWDHAPYTTWPLHVLRAIGQLPCGGRSVIPPGVAANRPGINADY